MKNILVPPKVPPEQGEPGYELHGPVYSLAGTEISCEDHKCPQCCTHDERDHGICMDCEDEEDPGAAIDRAHDMDRER